LSNYLTGEMSRVRLFHSSHSHFHDNIFDGYRDHNHDFQVNIYEQSRKHVISSRLIDNHFIIFLLVINITKKDLRILFIEIGCH
jgi:hypothetical protein